MLTKAEFCSKPSAFEIVCGLFKRFFHGGSVSHRYRWRCHNEKGYLPVKSTLPLPTTLRRPSHQVKLYSSTSLANFNQLTISKTRLWSNQFILYEFRYIMKSGFLLFKWMYIPSEQRIEWFSLSDLPGINRNWSVDFNSSITQNNNSLVYSDLYGNGELEIIDRDLVPLRLITTVQRIQRYIGSHSCLLEIRSSGTG